MGTDESAREIRINPIVPSESVLVATARGSRPQQQEERIPHESNFLQATPEDIEDFAAVLKCTVQRLDKVLGGAQYNYYFHSVPRCETYDNCDSSCHWHMEICPRNTIPSGFVPGSGLFVTTISPGDAAAQLRDAL